MTAAFQPNVFQNNSFQTTAFSIPAFQRCAFQSSAFQAEDCPTPQQDGRSGYWRLFFYKMQEEALKKEVKEAAEQAVEEIKDEQVERQATKKRKSKEAPRTTPVVEYPEVRFKRKPIYTSPQPVAEQFPAWLTLLSYELDSWVTQIIPLWNERQQVIISTQQKAANDADARLRLLLLAA